MVKVIILGAGAIGLTTAVQVQDALPDAEVTVLSDGWDHETTTAGAGGLFRLWGKAKDQPPDSKFRSYAAISTRYWKEKGMSSDGPQMGIMPITLNEVFTEIPEREMFIDYCESYQEMSKSQLANYGPECIFGYTVGTWITNGPTFLRYLRTRFTERGGKCERRKIENLKELSSLECDVIVNCTGLGSRWLFNDKGIYAVRGETLKVLAPWIKQVTVLDGGMSSYIIPQAGYVVVGGTREDHDYDVTPRVELGNQIMERAAKLYPPIKNAKIMSRWAGLRPMRDEIRLEVEQMTVNGKNIKVVHNYGHGPVGVAISWGCASHATRLVLEQLGVATSSKL